MEGELPGLTALEARKRLRAYGPNKLALYKVSLIRVLLRQFNSPLIYLLVLAAVISLFLSSPTDALTIVIILLINALLGFIQEYRSEKLLEKLHGLIKKMVTIRREGRQAEIAEEEIVPGDVVILEEGDIVPADGRIVISEGLEVNESTISGETLPVDKSISEKVFSGTVVTHGYAEMVVDKTGMTTELGQIAYLSSATRKHSKYEENIARLSGVLMRVTFVALFLIFTVNVGFKGASYHNVIATLLFVTALAISIVPEALPVITTLTLSTGALRLAGKHVVVKRLSAVEDLGNIEILCTDKTGTITENKLTVKEIKSFDKEKMLSLVHFCLEPTGAIDEAIRSSFPKEISAKTRNFTLLEYLPFDSALRRRFALVKPKTGPNLLVVFGAAEELVGLAKDRPDKDFLDSIRDYEEQGVRCIVVGCKEVGGSVSLTNKFSDTDLSLLGYFALVDPVRATAVPTINLARKLSVAVKIITGDSLAVARYTAQSVGLLPPGSRSYTGRELAGMGEEEFSRAVQKAVVFAKISPEQKYKIVAALKKKFVVAYQGDGINDAPALKVANVGIAVSGAADVAVESADIILFHQDLKVIIEGIGAGRKIFANIDKYIKHTMVSNWGNFFAIAAISVVTDVLPLLPIQILMTGLLSDLPLLAVATDNVDEKDLRRPARYELGDLVFLPLILGAVTFVVNLGFFFYFRYLPTPEFRTLWFLLVTSLDIMVIISVRRNGWLLGGTRPSKLLAGAILGTLFLTFYLPYSPIAFDLSLVLLPRNFIVLVLGLTVDFLFVLDVIKVLYYRGTQKLKWPID